MLRCSFALSLAREINSFPHRSEFDSPGRAGIWIFGIIFEKARLPQWLMSGKGCCGFGLGKSSVLSITQLVKDFSGEHDLLSYLIFLFYFSSLKPFELSWALELNSPTPTIITTLQVQGCGLILSLCTSYFILVHFIHLFTQKNIEL